MQNKFIKAASGIFQKQKGITGLETAIILIAFVTVASVLAYSVLSSGIYTAERGKESVYGGLESAQSTMSLKGAVVGLADDAATPTKLVSVTFHLAMVLAGDNLDLTKCFIDYWDSDVGVTAITLDTVASGTSTPTATSGDWSYYIDGSTTSILAGTSEACITVVFPAAADITSYDTFTIEINPPTGAAIRLQRTIGPIAAVMGLN
jgi:flagellin FlaB